MYAKFLCKLIPNMIFERLVKLKPSATASATATVAEVFPSTALATAEKITFSTLLDTWQMICKTFNCITKIFYLFFSKFTVWFELRSKIPKTEWNRIYVLLSNSSAPHHLKSMVPKGSCVGWFLIVHFITSFLATSNR